MRRTLTQLKSRLAQAMAEADDVEAVLELVREAVRAYDFDESDVFPAFSKLVLVEQSGTRPVAPSRGRSEAKPYPPYTDGMGNVWSGKGRRPDWLHQALENDATLEDLMPEAVKVKRTKRCIQSREPLAPYADDVGNTWSGKGRRPNWLVEALAMGVPLGLFATAKPVPLNQVLATNSKRRKGERRAPLKTPTATLGPDGEGGQTGSVMQLEPAHSSKTSAPSGF